MTSRFRSSSTKKPSSKSQTCWPTRSAMPSSATCYHAPRCCCHASCSSESESRCWEAATKKLAVFVDATLSLNLKMKWDTSDRLHQQRLIQTRFRLSNSFWHSNRTEADGHQFCHNFWSKLQIITSTLLLLTSIVSSEKYLLIRTSFLPQKSYSWRHHYDKSWLRAGQK